MPANALPQVYSYIIYLCVQKRIIFVEIIRVRSSSWISKVGVAHNLLFFVLYFSTSVLISQQPSLLPTTVYVFLCVPEVLYLS